mgnify:CR=1 FL=1
MIGCLLLCSEYYRFDEEYFEDRTTEVNTVGVDSTFLSEDNGVKLAKKEKTEEYLGGNSRSDIFRY